MKRIGLIQVLQETNCFNPVLTVRADYENFGVGRAFQTGAQDENAVPVGKSWIQDQGRCVSVA